ncbi:hypothetical protein DCAR_0102907 [Daucus carota subsp. sativus]|uniref:Histidine-containing phosphotransfer protein n=1 Tax=Daucus carota subsp. sativus TaxID=79200 RepID=A0A162AK03_DAUCS|nr:hypothetical protein DCAR_0102907 [Daucus carota subsp. sativus]
MDSVKQLRRDYTTFVKSAHREGIISRQFIHLQALHGADEYPQFVSIVVNQFITLSEGILPKLDLALEQNLVNSEVKSNVHRMKGSSMRYTCVGYSL